MPMASASRPCPAARCARSFTTRSSTPGTARPNCSRNSCGGAVSHWGSPPVPCPASRPRSHPRTHPLTRKFASSAAHVAGRRLTSAETGTWLGEHFTVTLDQLKQEVDQLFVSGVNHVIYHGTAYSPRNAAWPGWQFYASTELNPRNAIWQDLPALNRYVARVQSILQPGRPDNDVLLYWPLYDNWHDTTGLRSDFEVQQPGWLHEKPVGAVARLLWQRGYGFDYVSDRLLETSVATPDYRAIVVPPHRH